MFPRQSWLPAVTVLVLACGGGGGSTQPDNSPPAAVTKRTGDGQSALVGTTVAITPTVTVTDAQAKGLSGINVTFTASSGDVLGTATATTGSDGVASVGSWKLGTTSGAHLLTATVAGLVTNAQFTATGTAGPATALVKLAGDAQSATAGSNVATAPSVSVKDAFGNAVANANVTFAVGTGGGSVTGGQVVTTAAGAATVGSWRLGATPGANTLVASATGIPTIPAVTFTATALLDACTTSIPAVFGATVSGTLGAGDCLLDGAYYADLYAFTFGAGVSSAQIEMISTALDPWLDLTGPNFTPYYGSNNNSGGGTTARQRVLAPPGNYLAIANTFNERETGAYTFGLTAWNGDPTACEGGVLMIPGATTYAMNIASTDCSLTATGGPFFADGLNFFAYTGRTYTITMTSTAVDPVLRLFNGTSGALISADDNSGGGTTARITWTPTSDLYGIIFATTAVGSTTGAFTISVTQAGTAAAAALSLPLGTAPGVRRPASARAGAPWVFPPELLRRAAPSARQP